MRLLETELRPRAFPDGRQFGHQHVPRGAQVVGGRCGVKTVARKLGLMAGCSSARDFLKAFLTPLTGGELKDHIRDYVDDVVVMQLGTGTTGTAKGLQKKV